MAVLAEREEDSLLCRGRREEGRREDWGGMGEGPWPKKKSPRPKEKASKR